MASTSASSSNTEGEPENELTNAYEEIIAFPFTSTTPLVENLVLFCLNCCSFFLSLCYTRSHSNASQENIVPSPSDTHAFQEIAPSPSDIHALDQVVSSTSTNAFEQVVPSTATSARSTLVPQRKLPYDVFINHRGPDVKHTLAAALYKTLTSMGLRVFLDTEELEFGDFLPKEIEEAMCSASLHIAIFSKNYAQSSWCLAELSFMLKTGTQIFPIFYHVQPDDVRYAKGVYAEAFSRYTKKGRFTLEKLDDWKNALNSVSYNVGAIVHNDNDQATLLKKIIGSVLKVVKNVPFVVANHPIGLDEILMDFEKTTLQLGKSHDDVQIVGIWGMGGSGKTTLAKKLYNNKYRNMDKSSFLLDVRDAASKSKLHKKQKKLLEDLGLSTVSIDNVEEGQGILASCLRSIRVLIVLDDVDSVDQLNALVPNKDILGWGSLIVVTSREFDVLRCWGISPIYKMKPLVRPNAKQLFCWHAFLQPSPHQAFEDLVENFLDVCHGLPLSLKVFGAQLYNISKKDYWESLLQKISRILPKDIKERLKISYDALDDEEKQIFLDIACFFIGEKRTSAIAVWDGSGWNGQHSWDCLLNKCLVEFNDDEFNDDYIRMHNHLRDLGREIANHQSPYRLWSPQQIISVGNEVQGIAIRGIMAKTAIFPIDIGNFQSIRHLWSPQGIAMENEGFLRFSQDGKLIVKTSRANYNLEPSSVGLKIFHARGNYYNQVIGDLSRELVWLRWHDIEQRNLQSLSLLENLRVLELHEDEYGDGEHHLEELWETENNAPVQLRELVIDGCSKLQGFPKSIRCLIHLKKIVMRRANKLSSLPDEFCLLQSLEYLELNCCKLLSLPNSFGQLRNLRHLALSSCYCLRWLPVSFMELTLLQYLSLLDCFALTLRPDILKNITKLQYLNIHGCYELEELPRHITNQASLTDLTLSTQILRELPMNIGELRKLQKLFIGGTFVSSLPTSIGDLSSLTSLNIYNCPELECLPESMGRLHLLSNLVIRSCPKLECLPESLGRLDLLSSLVMHFSGVKSLPISLQINLQILEIRKCPIRELVIGKGLKKIELEGADKVSKISFSEDLPNTLESIVLRGCPELDTLPSFAQSTFLRKFELLCCPKLDVLFSFAQLSFLREFVLEGCCGVEKIQGLEHCRALEILRADTSWKEAGIETLEGLERLRRVQLTAISRSGVEGCIQSMQKWPKEDMIVCTEALPDAAALLNSFVNSSPNLSIFDSLANQKINYASLKWPSTAGCILLCFVANCESPRGTQLQLLFKEYEQDYRMLKNFWRIGSSCRIEQGKWAWTALITQHSRIHNGILDRTGFVKVQISECGGGKVEKGVVVTGEEDKLWEVFTRLCVSPAN